MKGGQITFMVSPVTIGKKLEKQKKFRISRKNVKRDTVDRDPVSRSKMGVGLFFRKLANQMTRG